MRVPLYLVSLMGLAAGGVLHHREHAAVKERGLLSPQSQNNYRPYGGGSGHGLGNYVAAPAYDTDQEKLRVIKITKTFAIPYPVHVPYGKQVPLQVPLVKPLLYPVPHQLPVSIPKQIFVPNPLHGALNYPIEHLKAPTPALHSSGNSYSVHQNLDYDIPNTNYATNVYNHNKGAGQYLSAPQHSYAGNSPQYDHGYSHSGLGSYAQSNSLDYSAELFGSQEDQSRGYDYPKPHPSKEGINFGEHSHARGYSGHGFSSSKPFKPSQEYTPPELNDPHYSHSNEW